ncbi:MAG: hypothetical protein JWQ63_4246 [Mucilaginibacter sp.]|nr:hypothetical protein [Mucilaginibacter sp.]
MKDKRRYGVEYFYYSGFINFSQKIINLINVNIFKVNFLRLA